MARSCVLWPPTSPRCQSSTSTPKPHLTLISLLLYDAQSLCQVPWNFRSPSSTGKNFSHHEILVGRCCINGLSRSLQPFRCINGLSRLLQPFPCCVGHVFCWSLILAETFCVVLSLAVLYLLLSFFFCILYTISFYDHGKHIPCSNPVLSVSIAIVRPTVSTAYRLADTQLK